MPLPDSFWEPDPKPARTKGSRRLIEADKARTWAQVTDVVVVTDDSANYKGPPRTLAEAFISEEEVEAAKAKRETMALDED